MWSVGERVLLTLWIGSLWTTGYLVAPVLFNVLERSVAGTVAGQLFTLVSYLGLLVIGILLVVAWIQQGCATWGSWRNRILLLMLVLVVVGQFVLQPMMAELKAAGLQADQTGQFARLHGLASILYLLNSILGLVLVSWDARRQTAN
ncbi:MAG: DUF4149 domain-containing protein [Gammaproteobacteria bacterium]